MAKTIWVQSKKNFQYHHTYRIRSYSMCNKQLATTTSLLYYSSILQVLDPRRALAAWCPRPRSPPTLRFNNWSNSVFFGASLGSGCGGQGQRRTRRPAHKHTRRPISPALRCTFETQRTYVHCAVLHCCLTRRRLPSVATLEEDEASHKKKKSKWPPRPRSLAPAAAIIIQKKIRPI